MDNHTHIQRLAAIALVAVLALSSFAMLALPASADIPPVERKAIITLSADDGDLSIYQYAYPILAEYDIPQTFFVPADYVNKSGYCSLPQLLELQAAGWEIGSHGVNHTRLTTLTFPDAMDQLSRSKSLLTQMGLNVETVAYPLGSSNQNIANYAREVYLAARSTSYTYERYCIDPSMAALSGEDYAGKGMTLSLADTKALIDRAIDEGKWLNLFYHKVNSNGTINEPTIPEDVYLAEIAEYLADARQAGLCDVLTFRDGYYRSRAMSEQLTPSIIASGKSDEMFNLNRNYVEDVTVVVEGVTYRNVLPNPSFELAGAYTSTGYTRFGGITNWGSSADAFDGEYALRGTANPGATASTRTMSIEVDLADAGIVPGDRLWYGMSVRNIANVTEIASQIQFSGDSGVVGGLSAMEDVIDSYARYPTEATAESRGYNVPAGATKCKLTLRINGVSEGATEAIFLTDGWFLTKMPYNILDRAYTGLTPAFDYVASSTHSTSISMTINGQTYSIADALAGGETARISVPYSPIMHIEDILVAGSGQVRLSVDGTRVLDSIGPEIVSVTGATPDITVTTAPYVGDGKAICYWDDRITTVVSDTVMHYTGTDDACIVDLAGGAEQRIVSTTTYRIDAAMSPLYAIIPVVVVLAVLGSILAMVGRRS